MIFPVPARVECALARTLHGRHAKAPRADAAVRTTPASPVWLVLHRLGGALPSMHCMSGRLRHIALTALQDGNTSYAWLRVRAVPGGGRHDAL
jgi:hypothetical protein